MPKIHSFHVVPSLPERVHCLSELAYNLRWAWDSGAIELFRRLDQDLWEQSGHNPALMLGTIDQKRLLQIEKDEAFLAHMDRVYGDLKRYLEGKGWFGNKFSQWKDLKIAYFSAEFGLTECLPNYAGGLGILAGDHLKSCSDLGVPLVGVGLLYQQGYFRQYLNADGWQQETYPENDFYNLPIRPALEVGGKNVLVDVDFPGRKVWSKVWKVDVGRIQLLLLDTNIPQNSPTDRDITDTLYGGDREMRIQQEIVLGIGGMRVLKALNIRPTVCHMNEGHSAFLALERARVFMEENQVTYREARQATCSGNIFTTHTPVPAGFDKFDSGLMDKYFGEYASKLGLDFSHFMAFGREKSTDLEEPFNMAVLASKHSSYTNGVSQLHGKVTRRMAQHVWGGYLEDEVPVGHVTNGVHTQSFISREMGDLLDRYLGPGWRDEPSDQDVWDRINEIPDEELWRTHERRKERFVAYVRRRLTDQLQRRGASESDLSLARCALNSEYLTIGFARRFAAYKRANLILRDPDRLMAILCNEKCPVQIVFAGKAHPQDSQGKELIRQIIHFAHDERIRRRVVFLENYDLSIARYLVQGVDVWLNTPRRPMEASGTSGMKILANGGLNLSVLDGWWCEGYSPETGWAIGNGEEYEDHDYQDRVESQALFNLLEQDVVPLYYNRDSDGLPKAWVTKMKSSMKKLCPQFNSNRMVAEYTDRFYVPAAARYARLTENSASRAKNLVVWRSGVWPQWKDVKVVKVETVQSDGIFVGASVKVKAIVKLGTLLPENVHVEMFQGNLDSDRRIQSGHSLPMQHVDSMGEGLHAYEGEIPCQQSGLRGFSVRVVPFHEDAILPYELPLISWED
jgi:starch phosphorylase